MINSQAEKGGLVVARAVVLGREIELLTIFILLAFIRYKQDGRILMMAQDIRCVTQTCSFVHNPGWLPQSTSLLNRSVAISCAEIIPHACCFCVTMGRGGGWSVSLRRQ